MTAADATAWRQCALMTGDREARLNCFDRWANQRQPSAGPSDITPDATLINATKVVAPQPPVTLSPVDITILTPQNMTA